MLSGSSGEEWRECPGDDGGGDEFGGKRLAANDEARLEARLRDTSELREVDLPRISESGLGRRGDDERDDGARLWCVS